MAESYWLDTNVILRYLTDDHHEHAELAARLMDKAIAGEIEYYIHPLMIAECCYVLTGGIYQLKHKEVSIILKDFILSDGIKAVEEDIVIMALDDFSVHSIDFEDAYLSAVAAKTSPHRIVSFNKKDFKKVNSTLCFSPEEV